MTLEELERKIESGLTRWPEGATALCPLNGEQYDTYAIAYVPKLGMTDDEVAIAMLEAVCRIRMERKARFISWRKHFEWVDEAESFQPADVLLDGLHKTGTPVVLNLRRRTLRARFLITAKAEREDWPQSDAGCMSGD